MNRLYWASISILGDNDTVQGICTKKLRLAKGSILGVRTLQVSNKDPSPRVWLDLRFSNGGVPYDDLLRVPGFPRWIGNAETFLIEMGDWAEVLYRRSKFPAEEIPDPCDDVVLLTDLYRIGMPDREHFRGSIWPLPFHTEQDLVRPTMRTSVADMMERHWLIDNDSRVLQALKERFRADEREIQLVREEFLKRNVQSTITLHSKVRTVRKYLIEPYIKAAGYGLFTIQVFVRLTNLSSNQAGTRLIIETESHEALALLDSFMIKDGYVVAKPRNTFWGTASNMMYRDRGFRVPVREPVSNFFPHN